MNDNDIVIPNSQQISKLRKSCGLTQQDLAKECGYAVRTIGKAEQGESIKYSSLVAIATALQRYGSKTTALQLCSIPEEIACQFAEAYRLHEQGMVEKIQHLLDKNLQLFIAGDPSVIPFAGTYHGVDALQKFWDVFFSLSSVPTKMPST